MKTIKLFLLLILFLHPIYSQNLAQFDWNVPAGTKSISEVKYIKTNTDSQQLDSISYKFSENSNLTNIYYNKLEPVDEKRFLYNSIGKITEEAWLKSGEEISKYIYEYNPDGKIKKITCKAKNNDKFSSTYRYDSQGKLTIIKSDVSVKFNIENKYDSHDRIYKSIVGNNTRNQKEIEYVYDDNGRVIQETIYQSLKKSKSGKRYQQSKIMYSYNDIGKLKEKLNYLTDDIIEKFEYSYNNNGDLIKWEKLNPQGKLEFYVEYRYE